MITLWMVMVWACGAEVTTGTPPVLGVETVVSVTSEAGLPERGQTVRVVHRPDMHAEREVAIGITDARGRVRWTPEWPGVAEIRADESTRRLHVRTVSAGVPPSIHATLALVVVGSFLALGFGLRRSDWRPR